MYQSSDDNTKCYQIISSEFQVITIYASTLKEAIGEAHETGIKIISITELRK